ncbi:sulfurtransferase TusA family protein [Sphingobium phenoxybenzoativorans]|uniref:Sulfurtransferase TusA family protein n=1 Tax=Sphingobium phenoxybenzoativorans TaxID=1592790 RepID=A0A975Q405_9SPHN|nr:sulfurtransferase TusA family protein [Sphingobium phenoxybenzoativorans]QUT08097.1 sulfurtransferase TusA family protein [Sphingobium phenoxybenzoativorans]
MIDPVRIDARGMRCPWPALRAAKAMRAADRVMIWADDPNAPKELAALAASGWRLTDIADPLGPCFLIEKENIVKTVL